RPTLVVLDSFEFIADAKQQLYIRHWLRNTRCSALIVSLERQEQIDTHAVYVPTMRADEQQQLIELLLKETENSQIFTEDVRLRISGVAEGVPCALEWIVAQIDLNREPETVLDELKHGEGDAAQRAFNRAFNLPQLGDDGRAVLLALSIFRPSAARPALSRVAGLRGDLRRLDEAVTNLSRLWLIKGEDLSRRLKLEGLTLRLAKAALAKNRGASHFRRRFVEHFRELALRDDWSTDHALREAEKSNVVTAMQLSSDKRDWDTVLELFCATVNFINSFRVWKASIVGAERESEDRLLDKRSTPPLFIEINHRDAEQARRCYEQLPEKLGLAHLDLTRLYLSPPEMLRRDTWKYVVLSVVAFQLGVFAHRCGEKKYPLARKYFKTARVLKESFKDYCGVGITCNNLGVTLAQEKGASAKARKELERAHALFTQEHSRFEHVAQRNLQWHKELADA
ncbi:MAG TPA: hypothetical protein VGV59_05355, partial [Pyrinomonadaceae bacterium]|nr:hypothetical protein [Pyrinomonadaceae bacterium]